MPGRCSRFSAIPFETPCFHLTSSELSFFHASGRVSPVSLAKIQAVSSSTPYKAEDSAATSQERELVTCSLGQVTLQSTRRVHHASVPSREVAARTVILVNSLQLL